MTDLDELCLNMLLSQNLHVLVHHLQLPKDWQASGKSLTCCQALCICTLHGQFSL